MSQTETLNEDVLAFTQLGLEPEEATARLHSYGYNELPANKPRTIWHIAFDVLHEPMFLLLLAAGSIVHAIKLGLRIYTNLQKAMSYILAIHVPIAGLSLLPLAFGLPQLFWPVHIVFMELVIDPTCSIVFEAEQAEEESMQRPPRHPEQPLFGGWTLLQSLLQGLILLTAVFALYMLVLKQGLPESAARALAFSSLVIGNIALIFTNRSQSQRFLKSLRRPNRVLWWVVSITLSILLLINEMAIIRELFHFKALHWHELALASSLIAICILLFEGLKYWNQRYRREQHNIPIERNCH